MHNLPIAWRIGVGFAAVLALLAAVAGTGWLKLRNMKTASEEYAALMADLTLVNAVDRDVQALETLTRDYLAEPTAARSARVDAALAALRARSSARAAASDANGVAVRTAQALESYGRIFSRVRGLIDETTRLREDGMNKPGAEMQNALSFIIEQTSRVGNLRLAAAAGRGQERLLLTRLYANRFLDSRDVATLDKARALVEPTMLELTAVADRVSGEQLTAAAALALTAYPQYLAAMEKVSELAAELARERDALNAIGGQIGDLAETARNASETARQALSGRINADVDAASSLMPALTSAAVVVGAAFAVGVALSVVRPVRAMTDAMRRLADGDVSVDVPARGRRDEIGGMADAVEVFKENAMQRMALESRRNAEQAEKTRRAARIDDMIRKFEREAEAALNVVAASAEQLNGAAAAMTAQAQGASRRAVASAAAADVTSGNVQTAAAATEQMTSSIGEIAVQIERSNAVVVEAGDEARRTGDVVNGLAESALRIGQVVDLIHNIAAQTNLLALNATIEAARAGEAGKGFAVVANEVKALAGQTARATDEIGRHIAGMQNAADRTVQAIDGVTRVIGAVNDISSVIAAAVAEQQAATDEIVRSVREAAGGAGRLTDDVAAVGAAAQETGGTAEQVLAAAQALTRQNGEMRRHIEDFLSAIRAA